jgi:hypothetical protein
MIRIAFASLVLLALSAAGAHANDLEASGRWEDWTPTISAATTASTIEQAQPTQVPTPSDGWFFHFPHDRVNLDHFEMRVDSPTFARVAAAEVTLGEFEVPIPAMTPGVHVVAFIACTTSAVCSPERSISIELVVTINAVGDISIVQRKR